MGMFKRIAKENARWQEAISRKPEFAGALKTLMSGFEAVFDESHPSYQVANSSAFLTKLLEQSQLTRDEAARLNMYDYAAAFSTIHCRIYFRIHKDEIINKGEPKVVYSRFGCIELERLHSDIRYLAWGVEKAGVDPMEYWECKELVDLYQELVIWFAKSKVKDGKINIADTYSSPAKVISFEWKEFEEKLKPSTMLSAPFVPPIK
jgi:hypothetical protein